ncbi:rRNA maturation protein [Methanococcoides burtonii]|uniref:Probable Brix domain-containing ribosomal biogenesis protein n=1 Tax=Methanococcoides burtonii (strain DSM 6242 / NBRC 107633 / OCM 468 / ACE-M) TaxID=259564 RepID=BRIX_METBU|nr:rRNA maturation protein [Methanococcoides burtonii]Q12ZB3.1 RecName: Full=Probable Brix domain-containing ribosomal biogenesis protein [Methanococcoides burtonii DSM 6242]ABE51213.1 Archaeal exosome complex IMP4-like, brix-domain protein [Methanococcoides burtonii DSM 6242]
MLITSSRKPSANTRTMCKYLASFFNCKYMTRGKMGLIDIVSLCENGLLMVVGDYHGSPGSIMFYDSHGVELLSIHLSVFYPDGYKYTPLKALEPSINGDGELFNLLSYYLDIPEGECYYDSKCLIASDDHLEFVYLDNMLFRLNIKNYRKMVMSE